MKIKLLTPSLLLATLFFSCKKDSHPTPPPTDSSNIVNLKKGLLLYLPFSGNFADSSGNNNPTTGVNGASLGSDLAGTASSAFDGSGNGQRVIVTNNGSIKVDTAYTVSMNVMLRSYQRADLLAVVKHATGDGWVFSVGTAENSTNIINMNTVDTTGNCSTIVQPYNSQLLPSTSALLPGVWNNVVTVFNKGVSKIYINGQLNATLTTPNSHVPDCMSSNVIVGGWWDGDVASINGKLDEVRLYDRPLNANEIAKLAEGFSNPGSTVPDLTRGLLVYLPFNGSIADSSGHNNPTQIVGTGAGLTYDMHGYANSAFGGVGTSGRLEVTNNGSIQFDTAFSISLSFMERTISGNQVLASLVKVADGKGPSFLVGNSMINSPNLWFGAPIVNCDDYGTRTTTDTTAFIPQPESWYNLVCTFRKGTLRVYVNGNQISQTTVLNYNSYVCPDAKFVVGGWWQNDPLSINGKIDNVRLYGRELNSAEIAMLAEHYQPNSNSIRQVANH